LPLARADVADVALNHLVIVFQIDVADKLHRDLPPIGGFQRQVFVPDVFARLQFREFGLVGGNILEDAQFPNLPAEKDFV